MMKYAIPILLILVACQTDIKDPRVQSFQDFLGYDKIKVIDQAVLLLDSIVNEKYDSHKMSDNYRKLLIDIEQQNLNLKELFGKNTLIELEKLSKACGLWHEIYLTPDTTYLGDGEIIYNEELECIACYKSTCDLSVNCLNSLSPEFVYNKMSTYF